MPPRKLTGGTKRARDEGGGAGMRLDATSGLQGLVLEAPPSRDEMDEGMEAYVHQLSGGQAQLLPAPATLTLAVSPSELVLLQVQLFERFHVTPDVLPQAGPFLVERLWRVQHRDPRVLAQLVAYAAYVLTSRQHQTKQVLGVCKYLRLPDYKRIRCRVGLVVLGAQWRELREQLERIATECNVEAAVASPEFGFLHSKDVEVVVRGNVRSVFNYVVQSAAVWSRTGDADPQYVFSPATGHYGNPLTFKRSAAVQEMLDAAVPVEQREGGRGSGKDVARDAARDAARGTARNKGQVRPQPATSTSPTTESVLASIQAALDNGAGGTALSFDVPLALAGTIIGKGGSAINDVRKQSGATVRLADVQDLLSRRVLHVNGAPQSTRLALSMLMEIISRER